MTKKVRIAIAGLGNCASALVQGLEYYKNSDANDNNTIQKYASNISGVTFYAFGYWSVPPGKWPEYWNEFKNIDIAMSIDDIGSRFEHERGGVWNKVEQNIIQFHNLPNTNVYLYPVINIQNILYISFTSIKKREC